MGSWGLTRADQLPDLDVVPWPGAAATGLHHRGPGTAWQLRLCCGHVQAYSNGPLAIRHDQAPRLTLEFARGSRRAWKATASDAQQALTA